ncbi:MAG: hypothetical protein Q8P76_03025 [bacterium]|nr:hypothetical protein [bacterium]
MDNHIEKIARILRVDRRVLEELELGLEKVTGRMGVLKTIAEENDRLLSEKLSILGLNRNSRAIEVYDALISKIESDDLALLKYIGLERDSSAQAKRTVEFVKKLHTPATGLFLKKEKAKQFLIAEPPKKILAALGYKYVEEMLQKEDLLEVYSALRFLEDQEWQNKVFFKQYETLRPDDFEQRQIEVRVLGNKWAKAAEKFVAKKYHNISHLKELGVIFVVPVYLGISGETLRSVSLLLHYLNEVKFYSTVFEIIKNEDKLFASRLVSLLRGDVTEGRLPLIVKEAWQPRFLVVQRYLSKNDDNDWRLFEPHINPEAIHWQKAEEEMVSINKKIPDFANGLDFWENLGTVGDFFKTDVGTNVLVSFNLVDTVMALVKRRELLKYLYHQQEALWNKIFARYFGAHRLTEVSTKYIFRGWFEV